MKNYIKILTLFIMVSFVMGCEKELPTASEIQSADPIVLDPSIVTPVTLAEGGTYTYELNMPSTQVVALNVDVERSNMSTAIAGRDYIVTWGEIAVPTLGPAEVSITIPGDNTFDDGETVFFIFSGVENDIIGVTGDPIDVLAVTIQNTAPSDTRPGLQMDWAGEFTFFGTVYNWNQFIDIDFFIGTDADPFAGAGGYKGATGSVPEVFYADDISDGTWALWANMYAGLAGNGIPDVIPISVSNFDNTSGFEFFTDTEGILTWTGDTPDGGLVKVGTIVKSGNQITLIDANGKTWGTVGN